MARLALRVLLLALAVGEGRCFRPDRAHKRRCARSRLCGSPEPGGGPSCRLSFQQHAVAG